MAPGPLRLTPRVTLVGSGALGVNITDAHDCHVYLLDGGDDAVLIDAGCGLASPRVVDNVCRTLDGRGVSRIFLTHAHADHAAGAASLAAAFGAEVLALPLTAAIVAAGDEEASGLRRARESGTYPEHLRLPPTPVRSLTDARVRVGDLEVEAVPTPGHAAGHCCFIVEADGDRVLFSGDLVFARGRVAVLATPDTDLAQLDRSLRTVTDRGSDVLLPGHGVPVLAAASAHLQIAVDHLDRYELPPGLLR